MSTQLCSGPSLGPKDLHPSIDATMLQEGTVVTSVVRRLLLNFISRPRVPFTSSAYLVHPAGNMHDVLQIFGSAAAKFVLLPYHTFNYLVISSRGGSRSPLVDISLLVLIILIHYRKCVKVDELHANNNLVDVEVLNGSLKSRGNSWDLPMSLVCPEGHVVVYAWKCQFAGQSGAYDVDKTISAPKRHCTFQGVLNIAILRWGSANAHVVDHGFQPFFQMKIERTITKAKSISSEFKGKNGKHMCQGVHQNLGKIIYIIWSWFYKDSLNEKEMIHPGKWIVEWKIAWRLWQWKYQLKYPLTLFIGALSSNP